MTLAQEHALKWLREHNGTGVLLRNQTLLAAGEIAPVMRATWKLLHGLGAVSIVGNRVTIL